MASGPQGAPSITHQQFLTTAKAPQQTGHYHSKSSHSQRQGNQIYLHDQQHPRDRNLSPANALQPTSTESMLQGVCKESLETLMKAAKMQEQLNQNNKTLGNMCNYSNYQ